MFYKPIIRKIMQNYKYLLRALAILFLNLCFLAVYALQNPLVIRGKVYNGISREPLAGIMVKEAGIMAVPQTTDSTGQFSITVQSLNALLTFEYPGFQSRTISVSGRETIEVYMLPEGQSKLDDLVALPMREIKIARDITGAIGSVKMLSMEGTAGISFDESVKGLVAGVHITSRSGKAGNGSDIDIRGISSLYTNNQPLLVVDGVIFDSNGFQNSLISGFTHSVLSDISPKDIESITFIKNGASIFGSKAANGVILVETSYPLPKTVIDAYVEGGLSFQPQSISMLNASQHRTLLLEQLTDQGLQTSQVLQEYPFINGNPDYYFINNYTNNTDWQKEIFRTGSTQNYFFRIRGGDEAAKYALSVGYTGNDGIITNNKYSRFTTRLNGSVNLSRKLLMIPQLSYTNTTHKVFEDGLSHTNIITTTLGKSPMLSPVAISHDSIMSDVLSDIDEFNHSNPAALRDYLRANNSNNDFSGRLSMKYFVSNAFNVSGSFSINTIKAAEDMYIPMWGVVNSLTDPTVKNTIERGTYKYNSFQGELVINYKKQYGLHSLNLIAGERMLFNTTEKDIASTSNSVSDFYTRLQNGTAKYNRIAGLKAGWNTISTFVSASWNYNRKYYANINASLDGSSRVGRNATNLKFGGFPFALFPSAEIGWRLSSEDFLKNIKYLDELKLRLSYSLTGNDDIGYYNNRTYYNAIPSYTYTALSLGNIVNDDLTWENTSQWNGGIDISLFAERFTLSVDVYSKTTRNLFLYQTAATYTGFDVYANNGGTVTNKGIEIASTLRVIQGAFNWQLGVNIATNKNKLTEFTSTAFYPQPLNYEVVNIPGGQMINRQGEPIGQFYGFKTLGVFTTRQEATQANLYDEYGRNFDAGDMHFYDADQNGIIDERDRQVIGNPMPAWYGGFSNLFTYKNFALKTYFTFSIGNEIFNYMRMNLESMKDLTNQTTAVLNRWYYEGQVTDVPRRQYNDPKGNARFSDRWIEDGSYLRLSEITLSYKFSIPFLKSQNTVVYITGNNLLTFTKYLGYDPEFSFASGFGGRSIDVGMIPRYKSVMAGLRIGL
jgi:TonB-linked SusC/RagA family outer membrane protein